MTPHPDFAPMDMSIQAALRKMHGKLASPLLPFLPRLYRPQACRGNC